MANESVIRGFDQKIIGYIETLPNGDQIVRDFYRKVLGRYDAASDTTRDFYGKIVARGNAAAILLHKN